MGEPIRVLIVEDSEDDGLLITRQLRKGGFDVQSLRVDTASSFTTALAAQSWDVVIADFSLPAFGGLEALRLLRESGQDIPFIIVSGTIGEDVAVAAMKAGAHDYVMKDDLARLVPAVRRELQEAEVRRARRRAEQALRESEEKYRSLFQNAYDAIFLMDEDIFVDCNPAAEEMFRCSKEEIVGHSPASLSPPRQPDGGDSRTKALKMIRAALTGTRQVFEWVHRRCDDSLFDAEVSLSRLFLGGKPMVLAIVRDVTERKRAEKMLRRRNRELTALYEIGRDISATLDLQTVLERIAMHARALLKADDSEVYLMDDDGETLRAIVALGEYAEHIKALPLRVGEGIVGYVAQSGVAEMVNRVDLDPRAVQVNGTPVEPQALICAPLTYQERVIGVISLARNESREPFEPADLNFLIGLSWQAAIAIENARMFAQEEQRVIELARALEKQRELDDLKDQLIQNVSHELRTPLGIIRGYAELLDTGELGELRPEQREPVAIIARRARMLGKLVSNLTTALEVETRHGERKRVNMAALARDLLADFHIAAERAHLTLTAQIAADLPPVIGDPVHLRRVLDNLLGNAVKFTPAGGNIAVRLWQDNGDVVLEVEDTGIGIPADKLERIFDRFYQVDGSMSRRYGGTGLGLSLVKEIVEAHGGRVIVESTVGEGSTFRVTLPGAKSD